MDTLETAKQTKTAYFIEYVYPIDAYANENINNVFIACWKMDISHKDVTIW